MNGTYEIGDGVHLTAAFDVGGQPTDPTVLTFLMHEPDGTITVYTLGTNVQLVRDTAGRFHVDWVCRMRGQHHYRYVGTGAAPAMKQGWFDVRPLDFAA